MMFAMNPAAIEAPQAGSAAEMGVGTAAVSPALLGPMPMGLDADSPEFATTLAAVGAAHVAVAEQHGLERGLYSGAQSLAMTTTVATEAMRAASAMI